MRPQGERMWPSSRRNPCKAETSISTNHERMITTRLTLAPASELHFEWEGSPVATSCSLRASLIATLAAVAGVGTLLSGAASPGG
jgi:hypothetical protein